MTIIPPCERQIIINLYLAQVEVSQIATQYGVSTDRIYGIVAAANARRKMKTRVAKKYQPRSDYDPSNSFPEFPSIITEDIGCYRSNYPLGGLGTFSSKGGLEQRGMKTYKTPKR